MESGVLEVRIDRMFHLREVAETHWYLENRKTQGKLLC
ncbi:MAG: zinc-binding dehydrogenase [Anaerolineae bacterium]|nr:zinc-binding dehydrogenase [Anaerolineae bacterium]